MESDLINTVGILAVVTTAVAAVLGYASERSILGTVVLAGFTAAALALCYAATKLGGWIGLVVAVGVVTFLAHRVGGAFGQKRGAVFVPCLWLGYCTSCAIGYWASGALGLVTIALPSFLVFWIALFVISGHLLPPTEPEQRFSVFRSLVTLNLGTNYPYHAVQDRTLVTRVPGNPYGQFFAGPGLVITGPAHAPIVWDGIQFKRIGEPGLTFTRTFETVFQLVDLRPQLRSFFIEAVTKDGIRVRVLTFMPFKLAARSREPKIGTGFPLDRGAIYKAVWKQPVQQERRRMWDEIVPITATRILRRIMAEYTFDDLCEPKDPSRDPRVILKQRLIDEVKKEVEPYGIELIGGGLSNLLPVEKAVIDNRIRSWCAEWERRIRAIVGEGRANALLEVERAHARAQADMLARIREVIRQDQGVDPAVVADMAALRFIEALEEMAHQPDVQQVLPDSTKETIAYMQRAVSQRGAQR